MKILLSAYACEPDRGSEPGVGWEWATRLALRHDVTVLTRANNQSVIQAALAEYPEAARPEFIYVDLQPFFIWLKKRGVLPVPVYYLLWQVVARLATLPRIKDFEIVHHVTFNSFRFPGLWWGCPVPVVLGPLGGGSMTHSAFARCFGKKWFIEYLRGLSLRLWRLNPLTILSLTTADVVIAVGEEMANRFAKLGIKAKLMLETAVPQGLEDPMRLVLPGDHKNFMLVGNLEPWKAWQIAFEAFSLARSRGLDEHKLVVVGTGQQLAKARTMAVQLGIGDAVEFTGLLPREALWKRLAGAVALVFPSVRDTSGNVVLEAMALSRPVVCFRHQGVAWITNDDCSIRIEPGDWEANVNNFANAIKILADKPELATRMGKAGRERVMSEFTWEEKIRQIEEIYINSVSGS